MKRIHIFNPVAGKGNSPELLKESVAADDESIITESIGDAERIIKEKCLERPDTHFIVYGGDGTINEAVNGVLSAGAGKEALLSVIPIGTGNDFVRSFEHTGEPVTVDAIKYNERYAVNILNMGFDCDVVEKTQSYKRLSSVSGSMAYMISVADTLLHKLGQHLKLDLELEDGSRETLEENLLLTLIANGRYYGGGFKSAPLALTDDGLLDVITVKTVSRMTFISMVSDYRRGTHINPDTMEPCDKFKKFIRFRRCRKLHIEGLRRICADGEIEPLEAMDVSVAPSAIRFVF